VYLRHQNNANILEWNNATDEIILSNNLKFNGDKNIRDILQVRFKEATNSGIVSQNNTLNFEIKNLETLLQKDVNGNGFKIYNLQLKKLNLSYELYLQLASYLLVFNPSKIYKELFTSTKTT
jgi:hypothetical protein